MPADACTQACSTDSTTPSRGRSTSSWPPARSAQVVAARRCWPTGVGLGPRGLARRRRATPSAWWSLLGRRGPPRRLRRAGAGRPRHARPGGAGRRRRRRWWRDRLGGDGYPGRAARRCSPSVALALDGVDGQVARRTGTVSALGARFDMEVDAFLVLVLSVHVAVLVDAVGAGHRRHALRLRRRELGAAVAARRAAHAVLRQGRRRGAGDRARGGRGRVLPHRSRRRWSSRRWPPCSGRSAQSVALAVAGARGRTPPSRDGSAGRRVR